MDGIWAVCAYTGREGLVLGVATMGCSVGLPCLKWQPSWQISAIQSNDLR